MTHREIILPPRAVEILRKLPEAALTQQFIDTYKHLIDGGADPTRLAAEVMTLAPDTDLERLVEALGGLLEAITAPTTTKRKSREELNYGTDATRRLWKAHGRFCRRMFEEWEAAGMPPPGPYYPPIPEECEDMRCGARTKSGRGPCTYLALPISGRCKFHGGMSTGARTKEGKKWSQKGRHRDGAGRFLPEKRSTTS